MENINQEKYPQPSKKAKKNRLLWVWRAEDKKNTHRQAKKKKKIDCYGYGEQKTGKIPTAKQKK